MKTQKAVRTNSIRRLLLTVPAICAMAFTACSDVASTAGRHPAVNLQSAVFGKAQTVDNVTIGPRTYDPETRDFERPWPFGPESGAQ
jgi:hypothetical protein